VVGKRHDAFYRQPARKTEIESGGSAVTTTDASLITSMSVREHFRDALETATHNQEVKLGDMTFVYVVNLLTEYCHSRALSAVTDESRHIKPLALIYAEAIEAPSPDQRNRTLQRLGDIALFIAGLFTDSLNRRVVDVDYYIGMGEAAYGSLHDSIQPRNDRFLTAELFDDLCQKFAVLVDLLGEIGEMSGLKSNADVLRAYEIWLKTGSDRARRQLIRNGIQPLTAASSSVTH
jgi:hypothetical protein